LANGRICVNVCGNPQGYTYVWSNGATTTCINGLTAGTYCVTITSPNGDHWTCCYTLDNAPVVSPPVTFNFSGCGSQVTAVIGESNCPPASYTWHWDDGSTSLNRSNISGCDSLTFTVILCDGSVVHHGFTVPHVYPTLTPVSCATGLGAICVPIECFRCPPYTYSWTPVHPGSQNGLSCYQTTAGMYTVCITNSCGDVICCQVYLPPSLCPVTVDVHVFIEGFYTGNGLMDNFGVGGLLHYAGYSTSPTDVDTIDISLVDPMSLTEVERQRTILQTDGSASVTYGTAVNSGSSYYIKVNHRNTIETWSAAPVTMSTVTSYDFTSGQGQAYGNNMTQTFDQMGWSFYSGDISDASIGVGYQDGIIEGQDYSDMENAVYIIATGYVPEDITGDAVVEGQDYSIMENNVYFIISSMHP
jgi:hypothetical protein